MEWPQVDELIGVLKRDYPWDYNDDQLTGLQDWMKDKEYYKVRWCVDVVTSRKGSSLPVLGDLKDAWRDLHQEGTANAPGQNPTPSLTPGTAYINEQRLRLSDQEYTRYLLDQAYRKQIEAKWCDEWQRNGGAA